MHFGENQLSRNLIGLSPLTPGHRRDFQLTSVRPSTRSYPRFSLPRARSSRFGSRTSDSNALFRLAFATAPPHGLASPPVTDSQAHFSIGTPSPHKKAPTDRRRMVSDTISLPSRGTFHLSLTVLVHYRSHGSIQAYPTVRADSHGIPRVPCYSGERSGGHAVTATGPSPSTAGNPIPFAYHASFSLRPATSATGHASHDTPRATPDG